MNVAIYIISIATFLIQYLKCLKKILQDYV